MRLLAFILILLSLHGPAFAAQSDEDAMAGSQTLRIDPVVLPVLRDEGATAVVTLVVSIQMDDAETVARFGDKRIPLQGAFFEAMTALLAFERPDGQLLDRGTTHRVLLARAEALLGRDVVRGLRLDVLDVRRL